MILFSLRQGRKRDCTEMPFAYRHGCRTIVIVPDRSRRWLLLKRRDRFRVSRGLGFTDHQLIPQASAERSPVGDRWRFRCRRWARIFRVIVASECAPQESREGTHCACASLLSTLLNIHNRTIPDLMQAPRKQLSLSKPSHRRIPESSVMRPPRRPRRLDVWDDPPQGPQAARVALP